MWSHHPSKKIAVYIPDEQLKKTEQLTTKTEKAEEKKPAKKSATKKPAAKK